MSMNYGGMHVLQPSLTLFQLQVVQDKFARFLRANNLEQDVGKLSHTMEQHGQRIQTLEEQTQVTEPSWRPHLNIQTPNASIND